MMSRPAFRLASTDPSVHATGPGDRRRRRWLLAALAPCLFSCAGLVDGSPFDTPFIFTNNDHVEHCIKIGSHDQQYVSPGHSVTFQLDRSRRHPYLNQALAPYAPGYDQVLKEVRGYLTWSAEDSDWRVGVESVDGRSPWDR